MTPSALVGLMLLQAVIESPVAAPAAIPAPGVVPVPASVEAASKAGLADLPALTDVAIAIDTDISTKDAKTGATFPIHLAEPIVIRGVEVVPAGTTGMGEIVHAATSRTMGKAGELVLAARYLDFDGRRLPLRSLKFGKRGKDNTNLGFVLSLAPPFGLGLFLVSGGEVRVPSGTIAVARTAAAFALPAAAAARLAGLPPAAPPVAAPAMASAPLPAPAPAAAPAVPLPH